MQFYQRSYPANWNTAVTFTTTLPIPVLIATVLFTVMFRF